jgi:predicted nucleic acid-binding Zn ribbon protein
VSSESELFPKPKPVDGTPLRDLVELTPPRQVALGALGRAKAAAAQRGFRPGDPARRRPLLQVQMGTAGPGARDPQLIGSTVGGLLDQLGGTSDQVAGVLKHRWAELVGPQVAEHCEYVSFEGGALTLRAHSTSWATQLKFLAPAMLGRFAADLGEGIVLEITVLNPGGPRFKTGPKRVAGRGERDTFR